jgi:hypothetical protein
LHRRLPYADSGRINIVEVAYTAAVSGAGVVVSAMSGTRPVIVDAQRALLAARSALPEKQVRP